MKFNVSGKAFAQQLQAVAKVINAKNAITILDNFLLRLEGDTLFVTGSDTDNVLTASLSVEDPEGAGSVVISSKRLLDVIKEVSNQPVTVIVDEETLEVKVVYASGEFTFTGLNGSEYPRRKDEGLEKCSFSIPAEIVASALDTTLFAVSLDSIRPIMTGILWDIKPDRAVFVSSDTHKLVMYANSSVASGIERSFILHSKPASIIRSIINSDIETIAVEADEKSAVFRFGPYELSCRLIKGKYPDYERVIPKNNPFTLVADREAFLAATRRVSIFASQSSGLLRLSLGDGGMTITAQDIDYNISAFDKVQCQYDGNPMNIGFKSQYMKEVLSNLKGEEVLVELSDPARPGLFKPAEQKENEEIVMLQMPMQVFE